MKLIDCIEKWTRRNLRWLLPFVIVMPFVLWWWNVHLDAVGYWLWLALHGQKNDELGLAMLVAVSAGLVAFASWLAFDYFKKGNRL